MAHSSLPFLILLALPGLSFAQSPTEAPEGCTTLYQGLLQDKEGATLIPRMDDWGHDYQAHHFEGTYCEGQYDAPTCARWQDVDSTMSWNDAWLSNMDCDGDGQLDRHWGFESYRGSGAWLSNTLEGYYQVGGLTCHWRQHTEIEAAPFEATLEKGQWIDIDGAILGPMIWKQFIVVSATLIDPCGLAPATR